LTIIDNITIEQRALGLLRLFTLTVSGKK